MSRARIKEVVDRRSDKLRIEYHRRDRRSRGLDGEGGGGGGSLPDRDPFSIVSSRDIRIFKYIYIYGGMVTRDQLPRPNSSRIRIEARVAAAAFSRAVCQTGGEDIRGHIFLPGKRTRSRGKTLANNEDKGGGEEGGKGGEEEERKKNREREKEAESSITYSEFCRGFRIIQPAFHEHAQPICRAVNS